ncbi:nodulation protein NodH [Gymnodinialimonas sp. 2305UL16-5]|uniref:nodulation protein NodH n=1 Tax=Gymnodinialimonas mytili TaxID=3126503 RepID=UPI003095D343
MGRRFDGFVLFAEMRTGSNSLEESLNAFADLNCLGEVFNPVFMGHHDCHDLLGYDMDRREADPIGLLDKILAQNGPLSGFRLFHDHDPRIIERVLPDPRIAKIILTRNPLDSYVSRKIAVATDQWRLTDVKHAKTAKVRFVAREFSTLLDDLNGFQARLKRALQVTGQSAFQIAYDDINDVDVLNGLAGFLGSTERIDSASSRLKRQNPIPLRDKVENYDEMVASLADLDRFGLDRAPDFEPERTAQVRQFVAHPLYGLLFCPIKGAATDNVTDWLAQIGEVGHDALLTQMTQKDLRVWMKAHPGFRSFSVLRHPVERLFTVFNQFILPDTDPAYAGPRRMLRKRYNVPIHDGTPGPDWSLTDHGAAFAAFAEVMKGNLAGQTNLRVDQAWASQAAILQGFCKVVVPQSVLHEAHLPSALPLLAQDVGVADIPAVEMEQPTGPFDLSAIYDGKIERTIIAAYRRDYHMFGFQRWAQAG